MKLSETNPAKKFATKIEGIPGYNVMNKIKSITAVNTPTNAHRNSDVYLSNKQINFCIN